MDTTQLLKGVLDPAVLAVVGERDGYGYDAVQRRARPGWTTSGTPSVYGTLRRPYGGGHSTSYVVPSEEGAAPQVLRAQRRRPARLPSRPRPGGRSPTRWTSCPDPGGGGGMSDTGVNDTIDRDVARSATAVRAAFADLPAPERELPSGGTPRDHPPGGGRRGRWAAGGAPGDNLRRTPSSCAPRPGCPATSAAAAAAGRRGRARGNPVARRLRRSARDHGQSGGRGRPSSCPAPAWPGGAARVPGRAGGQRPPWQPVPRRRPGRELPGAGAVRQPASACW